MLYAALLVHGGPIRLHRPGADREDPPDPCAGLALGRSEEHFGLAAGQPEAFECQGRRGRLFVKQQATVVRLAQVTHGAAQC